MKKMAIATCVASAFALAVPTMSVAATADVPCYGVNSCKGHGACKTTNNACKGQNSCKGKGLTMMTEAKCLKDHGTVNTGN